MTELYLRPLTVGELLDKAFRLYRGKFATLIGIVAAVLIPESAIRLLAIVYLQDTRIVDSFSQSFLHLLANVALVSFISNATLGKLISIKSAFSLGRKRYWSVFWANFLMGLAIGLPIVLISICATTAIMGLGYIFIILALPVIVYMSTKWSLAMPVIILENIGASEGLKRSWHLTDQFFWRVLGTSFAAGLLTLFLTFLPTFFAEYLFLMLNVSYDTVQIINVIIEQITLLIATPFTIAVTVLIYYDLRVRKEGFDLEVLAANPESPTASAI